MSSVRFAPLATQRVGAIAISLFTSLFVVACGGGGTSVTDTTRYTIGGAVSGLAGSGLVLQDNAGDNLTVSASGAFTFATPLNSGGTYAVTVATQPSGPTQNCVVTAGSGAVSGANVTSVQVACTTDGFTVGGSVTGLTGSGLVLQDNGGNALPVSSDTNFTFSQTVGSGITYAVTVATQPSSPTQVCSVANGSGTMGSANVSNVAVSCVTSSYTLSGTITGLVGTGLALQTGGVTIPISGNTFSVSLLSGTAYNVTASSQPSVPAQNCVVGNGSGTITSGNVANVTVTCSTNTYTVSGTITGLAGTGLVLQNNGTAIPITGSTFSVSVASGGSYSIAATAQPSSPTQLCVVANGSGSVINANVTNVTVNCTTSNFTLSGTITGLSGTGLVLQTNGTAVPVTGSTFSILLPSGTGYNILATTQPSSPTQQCTVSNGSGTITTANVSNVTVACVTRTFSVSGTISGLSGTGLALQTNGTAVPISGNTFSITLNSGTAFNIQATAQPSNPTQHCTVAGGVGTVTNANISSVTVSCVTTNFTVSGTITGYTGSGLVLQTNGTAVPLNGINAFSVMLASGTAYAIAVTTQPQTPAQYCTVANGTGTVTTANITNVAVSCRNEGQFAFVVDTDAGTVSSFTIASNTGSLGYIGAAALSTPTTSKPQSIALVTLPAGAGTFAYTADYGTADIGIFQVNPGTGVVSYVSAVSTGTAATLPRTTGPGSTPTSLAVDPSGNFLLVADSANGYNGVGGGGSVLVYQISPTLGTLAQVSGSPFATSANLYGNATSFVTVDPSDQYAFATNQFVPSLAGFTFNAPVNSGNLTPLSPWETATGNNPVWITIDPTDRFVYVSNNSDGTISGWVLGNGGTLTAIPGSPFATALNATTGAIAIDPTGRFLYVTDTTNNQVVAFTIDQSTTATAGVLTPMAGSPFPAGAGAFGPYAIALDPSGHFVYVGNSFVGNISMYTADPNSGALSPVNGSPLSYTGSTGANAIAVE